MSLDPSKFNAEIWPSAKVRQTFLDFFAKKQDHRLVDSGPVVPHDDPTLLFTNAGMNQFKEIFTGQLDPSSTLADCKRAVDTQKCIRAGGKHNDLDDVGKDSYHHTFFEMLGNWSFGDYFKEDAIKWAWELLTEVYQLPEDRLYATYFAGDEKNDIPADDEAKRIWLKYLPESRVLPFDAKDNFWEMGDTGPCGPCTEIHFDIKGNRDASNLVNQDDPSVIEIWNVVFMQFNRGEDGALSPLPAKHVDTGMGFERITSVLQNKNANYDCDLFTDLFTDIQKLIGDKTGYTGKYGKEDVDSHDMAYRVIADHARTLTFAITDGAVPDSDGRGYVLRRIVRRAVRYGSQCLNAPAGFFHKCIPAVVLKMKDQFPELESAQENVVRIVAREEELFLRTLDKGTKRLEKVLSRLKPNAKGDLILDGASMWDLYSTYGFPVDLTELMCDERGVKVDKEGYEAAAAAFKIQKSSGGDGVEMPKLDVHATDKLKKQDTPPTDDSFKYNPKERSIEAKILALYVNNSFVNSVGPECPDLVGIVLDKTNFYAEAGGQVADVGTFQIDDTHVFDVADVQSFAGYVLHIGRVRKTAAPIELGKTITTTIDGANRRRVTANHTITHVLNWALLRELGDHINQKGSKVVAEYTRFDFSNDGPVPVDKLARVDALVQGVVTANREVFYKSVSLEDAKKINGLRAVFGEKYPDPVRVVSIGVDIDALMAEPEKDWGSLYSVEFCGGTHLSKTGLAGGYVTLSEAGIAQGIRRIVGCTGAEADAANEAADAIDKRLARLEGPDVPIDAPESRQERLAIADDIGQQSLPAVRSAAFRERLELLGKRAFQAYKKKMGEAKNIAKQYVDDVLAQETKPSYIAVHLPDLCGQMAGLKLVAEKLSGAGIPTIVVSVDDQGKKPKVYAVAASPDKAINASEWVNGAVKPFGGRGGGRPIFAQATHEQLDKGEQTVAKGKEWFEANAKK